MTPCSSWVVYVIQVYSCCRFKHIWYWESQNNYNMSLDLYSWPWKSRSIIILNDLYYLWLNTCYRLDFSIDFHLIDFEELKKSEINYVAMMADLENDFKFKKFGLILKIQVNHQGQVTDFGFFEILDIENVRIDTKIKSIAGIQPEISKVIWKMFMTLSSKVKRSRYVYYFNIFDIPCLKIVRIDTKILSVWCLQPEIRKIIYICVWP